MEPRTSHTKTGCRTCKLRKVKCDEGRPACRRCVSTRRVCSGYGIWGGGGCTYTDRGPRRQYIKASIMQPPSCNSLHRMSSIEEQFMAWFHERTVKKLPGAFITTFWSALLQQTSLREPCVRHAVLTLSCVHKNGINIDRSNRDGHSLDEKFFVLQHYCKAIQQLQPHFGNRSRHSIQVTLITCVIFICMEYLRGNYRTGLQHLQSGLFILKDLWLNQKEYIPPRQTSDNLVNEWIEEALTRLYIQLKLFTQFYRQQNSTLISVTTNNNMPIRFSNYNEAWKYLEHIYFQIFDSGEPQDYQTQSSSCSIPAGAMSSSDEQDTTEIRLRIWFERYSKSASALHEQETSGRAHNLLLDYHAMARIMAATFLRSEDDESVYDHHTEHFLSILCTSIKLWSIRAHSLSLYNPITDISRSIVDMGWLPPLFYTSLKCRVHRIGWHAIRLLDCTFHKEGLWDSKIVAGIARQIVQIEENDFYKHTSLNDEYSLDEIPSLQDLKEPILPSQSRVTEIKMILPDATHQPVQIVYKQAGLWRDIRLRTCN